MSDTLKTIYFARDVRAWCKENLPVYESVVAYDLVMLIAAKYFGNESMTVKQIYTQLPHSYTAIRQHYKNLIKDGWLICTGDEVDRRVKHIQPTKKFAQVINEYIAFINNYKPNNYLTPEFQSRYDGDIKK